MAEEIKIEAVEAYLRNMLKGEFSSLHIDFNGAHAPNYETAEEWAALVDPPFCGYNNPDEWPSEEDRQKAIEQNSVWSIQWYPDTPVGFYKVYASTLKGAVESAVAVASLSP